MNWGKYTMFRSRYHRNSIVLKLWEASEKNQICDLVGIIKWVISIRKNSTRGEVRAASFKSLRPLMKLLDLARWEPTCFHCEETWSVKKDCKRFISQKENQAKCSQPKLSSRGGKQQHAPSYDTEANVNVKANVSLCTWIKKHLLDARHYWKRLWRANERDGGRKSGCCRKKTQIRLEKRGNVGCEIQLCSSSRAHVNSIRPTVRLFTAAASLDVALTASQFQSNNSCRPAQHPSAEAGTW